MAVLTELGLRYNDVFVRCQDNAALTRSGVKGIVRSRAPVASKIALAIAAGIALVVASPAPTAGWSGRLIGSTTTSGISENLRIG